MQQRASHFELTRTYFSLVIKSWLGRNKVYKDHGQQSIKVQFDGAGCCRRLTFPASESLTNERNTYDGSPTYTEDDKNGEHCLNCTALTAQPQLHRLNCTSSTTLPKLYSFTYTASTAQPQLHCLNYIASTTLPQLHCLHCKASTARPQLHWINYTASSAQPQLHCLDC